MPYYRRFRRKFSARSRRRRVYRYKKRKSRANKAPTRKMGKTAIRDLVVRAPLFPRASKRVKLPYYEYQLVRTGTAGAIATYFFSANGMFDPNITGTGHQPMGFDTMMTYYEQATVVASKISVCFMNNGANAVRCAVSLTPDTTAPVIGDMVENGLLKMQPLDAPAYPTGAGNSTRFRTISLNCDVASYFGRRSQRELLDDSTLYTTAAANPSEQVYFAISTWGAFTNDNTTVYFDVTLEYDAIFWEPRKVAGQ